MAKRPYRVPVAVPTKDEALVPTKVDASFLEIASLLHRVAELHDHINSLGSHLAGHKAEIAQFIKLANGSEQKRDAAIEQFGLRLTALEHDVDSLREYINEDGEALSQFRNDVGFKVEHQGMRLAALEAQVAGMQVNREVLTPSRVALGSRATGSVSGGSRYGFLPDPPLPEPTFTATAYVDGGHAATDEQARDPRWNHGDLDPETAEAQPQPDDDQATAVNDVQAVEERFESLGYVAKESA